MEKQSSDKYKEGQKINRNHMKNNEIAMDKEVTIEEERSVEGSRSLELDVTADKESNKGDERRAILKRPLQRSYSTQSLPNLKISMPTTSKISKRIIFEFVGPILGHKRG